jgi:hypothetical protein
VREKVFALHPKHNMLAMDNGVDVRTRVEFEKQVWLIHRVGTVYPKITDWPPTRV